MKPTGYSVGKFEEKQMCVGEKERQREKKVN